MNVALYGDVGKRWAMTERGRAGLTRTADTLTIGPSRAAWEGDALVLDIDEVTVPLPSRLKGRVRFRPAVLTGASFALDAAGWHRWFPVAPFGRIEVDFERPGLSWRGAGYLDSNRGEAPLARDFARWDWSRAATRDGAAVLYDVERRDGTDLSLALAIGHDGAVAGFEPPPRVKLPGTGWRIARGTRTEAGSAAAVAATLEDTPFYARSLVSHRLHGEDVRSVHESLSLDRFASPVVQMMLPFKMPRRKR
jgi:carotenoid 1,2-hydratase